jgi:hypothetical protein
MSEKNETIAEEENGRKRKPKTFGDEFIDDKSAAKLVSKQDRIWQKNKKKKISNYVVESKKLNVALLPSQRQKYTFQKPLTHKQREDNERENILLADFQSRLDRTTIHSVKTLDYKPWNTLHLSDALKIGVDSSSYYLLDWTVPETRCIGALCQVNNLSILSNLL